MDARQQTALNWLFGIAGATALATLVCITHFTQTNARRPRPLNRQALFASSQPTLGPPPAVSAASIVDTVVMAELPPLSEAELEDELLALTHKFAEPAETLILPFEDLPAIGGYDPVTNLSIVDLLKPVDDPSADWRRSAAALADLVLTPLELESGAPDIIVLQPKAPRWTATSFNNRWRLFGASHETLAEAAGSLMAQASNRARVETEKAYDTTKQLAAALSKPRLTGVIHSPPALAGPRVASSKDRLALAVSPEVNAASLRRSGDENGRNPIIEDDTLATPTTLLQQVRLLMAEPATSTWALRVEAALDAALDVRPGDAEGFARASVELRRLALEGSDLAELVDTQRAAVLLRRACYGIFRRLAAWDLTVQIESRRHRFFDGMPTYQFTAPAVSPQNAKWRQVAFHLAGRKSDRLSAQLGSPRSHTVRVVNASAYTAMVRREARQKVDALRLVSLLESYETARSPRLAMAIADQVQTLDASATPIERELAEQVTRQYRNANLRIAVADELISRLLPKSTNETTRLRDQVRGADVRGVASTKTDLTVRLTPDDSRWRVNVEARGRVSTRTTSSSGPVDLHSRGSTEFVADKPLEVDHNGVKFSAARCEANNRTRLVSVDSNLDSLPVVRRMVHSRARDEFHASRHSVRRHAERQVERRVASSLDARTSAAVDELEQFYLKEVIDRATNLGMEVEPIEIRTTTSRLIGRLRLAGDGQLGSHTPRTRAPSDSLASLQLHESAINNAASGLDLAGRRFTPESLRDHLAERLLAHTLAETELDTPPAEFVFANEQPLSIRFGDGQACVVLAVAEMRLGNTRYRDFKVHAYYKPEPIGVAAIIRRTGAIEIEGRLKTASRLRLHGVFGKVLSDKHPITLLAAPAGDHRFDDLMVTQMVLDDGWLGLAVGPTKHPRLPNGRVAVAGRYVR